MTETVANIVIVEDDRNYAEPAMEALKAAIPGAMVRHIEREHDFRAALPEFAITPPDLIVMDMGFPYCMPGPTMPEAPDEVREEGGNFAGLRCQRLLAADLATENVTVLFWSNTNTTALDEKRLRSDKFERTYFLDGRVSDRVPRL